MRIATEVVRTRFAMTKKRKPKTDVKARRESPGGLRLGIQLTVKMRNRPPSCVPRNQLFVSLGPTSRILDRQAKAHK